MKGILEVYTDANSSGVVQNGAIRALAPVTSDLVDAFPVGTGIHAEFFTFVDILTNVRGRIELSSSGADALNNQKDPIRQ